MVALVFKQEIFVLLQAIGVKTMAAMRDFSGELAGESNLSPDEATDLAKRHLVQPWPFAGLSAPRRAASSAAATASTSPTARAGA